MSASAMWWVTLGVGAVVVAVVALLLALIVRTAAGIRRTLEEVWVAGPEIARHTAHLDILRRINLVARDVVAGAQRIAGAAGRIQLHAEGCPGCPRCVTGWGPAGAGGGGGSGPGGGPAGAGGGSPSGAFPGAGGSS